MTTRIIVIQRNKWNVQVKDVVLTRRCCPTITHTCPRAHTHLVCELQQLCLLFVCVQLVLRLGDAREWTASSLARLQTILFNYNNDDHTITTIPWNHNNSLITITSCIASPHLENTTTIPTSTSHLILHRIIVKYYCLHQRHLFTIKLQILQ